MRLGKEQAIGFVEDDLAAAPVAGADLAVDRSADESAVKSRPPTTELEQATAG
jgi:hypothetical protein